MPIHKGNLRRSAKVKKDRKNKLIIIRYGGKGVQYAKRQYEKNLGHVIRSGKPNRLVDKFDDGVRASPRTKPYSRAYYLATTPQYRLTRVNGLRWLDNSIRLGRVRTKLKRVFVNEFTRSR